MSKITKAKKREKRVRVPAEYTEGALHFKDRRRLEGLL